MAEALALAVFLFGLLGWLYVAGAALVHPQTLRLPVTHLAPGPREDTFGEACFAISFCAFVVWRVLTGRRQ